MQNDLVTKWTKHVEKNEEKHSTVKDLLLATCPLRFLNNSANQVSEVSATERIRTRVNLEFGLWLRKTLIRALGKDFSSAPDGLLDNLRTGLLGTYRNRNVVLHLAEDACDPGQLKSWSLRWELSTIALLTGEDRFLLLLVDSANQKHEEVACQVEARTWLADLLVDPPAIKKSCSDCPFSEVCPTESRLSEDWLAEAPAPPKIVKLVSSVSGFMGRAEPSIIYDVNQYLLDRAKTNRRPLGYHPSTIGKEVEEEVPCIRVLYYDATGAKKAPFPATMYWIFNMGHAWHHVLQKIAKECDPNIHVELPVKVGRLVGHADLVDSTTIIDIKSKSRHSGSTPKGYIGQVHCYGWGAGKKQGAILTAYKSTGALEEKTFPLQELLFSRLSQMIVEADAFVDAGEEPPRFEGASASNSRCKACYFRETCWDG
tara:strand:+ start:6187 stop:7470 length:1284 start_codon:yes stop_codon:yes gene_type:complete